MNMCTAAVGMQQIDEFVSEFFFPLYPTFTLSNLYVSLHGIHTVTTSHILGICVTLSQFVRDTFSEWSHMPACDVTAKTPTWLIDVGHVMFS